jgi:hypothetical protein
MAVDNSTADTSTGDTSTGAAGGYAWLADLPGELAAQRRVMSGLLGWSAATPLVTSLSVGCSLGRGAADALSDIDAALGLGCEPGRGGAGQVLAIEDELVAALPGFGAVIDVLRHRTGPPDRFIRRIFAQFGDGTQLDLAIMAEPEVRRGAAAPDFVSLYQAAQPPGPRAPGRARPVTGIGGPTRSPPIRSASGLSPAGAPSPTPPSTCAAARCGRRTTSSTRPGTRSGPCGRPPRARCTRGTGCPRSWTTTRTACRRASRPRSPSSTPLTCAGLRGRAPRSCRPSARPLRGGSRPASRTPWPAT